MAILKTQKEWLRDEASKLHIKIMALKEEVEAKDAALECVYKWLDDNGLYDRFRDFLLGKEEKA